MEIRIVTRRVLVSLFTEPLSLVSKKEKAPCNLRSAQNFKVQDRLISFQQSLQIRIGYRDSREDDEKDRTEDGIEARACREPKVATADCVPRKRGKLRSELRRSSEERGPYTRFA
jgi:hypothetical protein